MKQFLLLILTAFSLVGADWRDSQVFYFLTESADGTKGSVPLVAGGYGSSYGPGALTSNMVFGVGHVAAQVVRPGSSVTAGTLSGLFPSTSWLPPSSPCGNVRNTTYPLTNYTTKDDFFIGRLCRDVEFGITEGSGYQQVGDIVTWYSNPRGAWQLGQVVAFEPTGALTITGTLGIAGDSGGPVFTWGSGDKAGVHYKLGGPAGRYVGVVANPVTEFGGFKVNGVRAVVFGNPRIGDYQPPPGWTNGAPVPPIGTPPVTVDVPRVPTDLTAAGGFLFTIASPDSSIWRLDPQNSQWFQVPSLPPIKK